jgi:hypothetical protein
MLRHKLKHALIRVHNRAKLIYDRFYELYYSFKPVR